VLGWPWLVKDAAIMLNQSVEWKMLFVHSVAFSFFMNRQGTLGG
jgi:hypothetical protein